MSVRSSTRLIELVNIVLLLCVFTEQRTKKKKLVKLVDIDIIGGGWVLSRKDIGVYRGGWVGPFSAIF